MRVLHILRGIINLLFILYSIVYISMFLLTLFLFFFDHEIPEVFNISLNNIRVNNTREVAESGKSAAFITAYFIILSLALGSLFYLRKFVFNITPRNIFTKEQIFYLKRIGQLIVSATLLKFLFTIFWRAFFNINDPSVQAELGLEATDMFGNEFFILAIGLFFIFLSEIFKIAKHHKQENDLTI